MERRETLMDRNGSLSEDIRRFRPRKVSLEKFRIPSEDIAKQLIERRAADPDRVFRAVEEASASAKQIPTLSATHDVINDTDPTVRYASPPAKIVGPGG